MKRLLILFFGLVAAASCDTQAPTSCDLEVSTTIALTNAEAQDMLTARARGPSCDKTIGAYEIRTSEGFPVWSWSAPLAHRFGDVFEPEGQEYMHEFLTRWTSPEIITTQAAPPFDDLDAGQTSFDKLTYEDVRARNLPMLCHFVATARQTCVFWEPAAGGATPLYERESIAAGE